MSRLVFGLPGHGAGASFLKQARGGGRPGVLVSLENRSALPSDLLSARGTHRYYSDEIAQTCTMVANLATGSDSVFAIEAIYQSGFQSTRHCHERGQISYARSGMMSIATDDRTLILPAGCAIWIPAGIMHQAHAFGDICVLSAYAEPDSWPDMPGRCTVFQVSDMFEHLMKRVITKQLNCEDGPVYDALLLLLYEELRVGRCLELAMPMPQDKRLRRVCSAILHEPTIGHRKDELARIGNMSCRTMTRLFQSELNMTYSAWVQQALVSSAVPRLAEGEPASIAAADPGYCRPSASTPLLRRRPARRPPDSAVLR